MTTVRPPGGNQATSDSDGGPNRRLPLRWLVIVLLAVLAGAAAFPAGGQAAAILMATAVAAALHKMIN